MMAASLILVGILMAASIFFSMAETAFFSLTTMDRDFIRRNYPRLGKWVLEQVDHPRKTLTTILVGNLVFNVAATAVVASQTFQTGGAEASVIATALFALILTVFGEIVPKIFALRFKIALSLAFALPIEVFARLIAPVRICLKWLTDHFLLLITRERSENQAPLSEDELKVLVQIGEEEGMLDSEERKRLHELFELGKRPVREIMTPRTDLVGLDADESQEKHFDLIRKHHFSYMPVFQNSFDQIIGVVDSQDYLLTEESRLRQIMRKPVFIPETKKISDLLSDFRQNRERFAICIDEHGGTAGAVTLEDVLEEIFGEFEDEYAKKKAPIQPLDAESFLVEGKLTLDDFNEFFHSEIKSSETTLGGYLMEQLGEIPSKGTRFEDERFEYQIQDMQRQRIRTVIVRKKP